MDKFDLIVIGGGPGCYVAAIRAAQLGAKVALIEKDSVGGTCLNHGCIPTKAIIACVNLYEQIKKAGNFGITVGQPAIDLKAVIERKNKIVGKLVKGIGFLLEKNGVTLIRGEARVLEPGKVEIIEPPTPHTQVLTANNIILATGASPICLPGITFDGKKYFSSQETLDLETVPEKLDIVGGGVIGVEFAYIFSSLGTQVTIYEALPEILPGLDEEIIAQLKRTLKRKHVNILTNSKFGPNDTNTPTLISIGRKPNPPDGKRVEVNDKLETNTPGVYAIGDLVSSKQLAHVAYEQGVIAAENAMGGNRTFSYNYVPRGIYTHPEIGTVGLTEKGAREKYQDVRVGKFPFAALGIAQAKGETEGFIKVISDQNNKLLGVHIIGPEATNLISGAVIALKTGLTIDQLAATFQTHPSYPEGLQEAALSTLRTWLHTI